MVEFRAWGVGVEQGFCLARWELGIYMDEFENWINLLLVLEFEYLSRLRSSIADSLYLSIGAEHYHRLEPLFHDLIFWTYLIPEFQLDLNDV